MNDDLGLMTESSSEFIRYKPTADSWYVDVNEKENQVDITDLMLDPSTLQVGWGRIKEGEAPNWKWDESNGYLRFVRGERPDEEYKRGFTISVKVPDVGWREWSNNGYGVLKGFTQLWLKISADAKKSENKGKSVHVKYTGSEAEKKGAGGTRIPQFDVIAWRDMGDKPAPVKESPKAIEGLDDDIPF